MGPGVRIRLAPAESPQTIGSSAVASERKLVDFVPELIASERFSTPSATWGTGPQPGDRFFDRAHEKLTQLAKFATNELVPVDMRDVSALLAAEVRSDDCTNLPLVHRGLRYRRSKRGQGAARGVVSVVRTSSSPAGMTASCCRRKSRAEPKGDVRALMANSPRTVRRQAPACHGLKAKPNRTTNQIDCLSRPGNVTVKIDNRRSVFPDIASTRCR